MTGPPASRGRLAPQVVDEVHKAFYAALLGAPERARTRALNGSTVASAAAGLLVAAGAAGVLDERPQWIEVTGFVAIVLWLAAAAMYLRAIAGPAAAKPAQPAAGQDAEPAPADHGAAHERPDPEREAERSADRKIRASEARLKLIQDRTRIAQNLSIAALVATAVVLGLGAFGPTRDARRWATVVLTDDGARELQRICKGPARDRVQARLDPASLEDAFVALTLVASACDGHGDVRLRAESIVGVAPRPSR